MKGGPTVGVYVEYMSMNEEIATMHRSSGRLSAISPGNTVRYDCIVADTNLPYSS